MGLRKLRKKYVGNERGFELGGDANDCGAAAGPAAADSGPKGESCPRRWPSRDLGLGAFGGEKGLPGQGRPGLLVRKSTLIKEDSG